MSAKRLKVQKNKPRLNRKNEEEIYSDVISFAFCSLTKNKDKKYGLTRMKEVHKTDKSVHDKFMRLLTEISAIGWLEISNRGKKQLGGAETIEVSQLKHNITDNLRHEVQKDTRVHVFRFGNGDAYRMIAYRPKYNSNILYILGFDFDYTLYDHGR